VGLQGLDSDIVIPNQQNKDAGQYCTGYSGSDVSSQNGMSEKVFIVDLVGFWSFGIEKICQHKKSVRTTVTSTVLEWTPSSFVVVVLARTSSKLLYRQRRY
jgi:hypothetical protein